MTHDQEQLEIKIDETLDSAHASKQAGSIPEPVADPEVAHLLNASEKFSAVATEVAAQDSFSRLLKNLPEPSTAKSKNLFTNLFSMDLKKYALPRLTYAMLALALVAWAIPAWQSRSPSPMFGGTVSSDAQLISQPVAINGATPAEPPAVADYESAQNTGLSAPSGLAKTSLGSAGSGVVSRIYPPVPYPYPSNSSITDTREFQKIYFSTNIRTRHVIDDAKHVETMVRGFNGRVDSSSRSEKYAYINFVIPKSQFEAFRAEIETIASVKFITEDVNQNNLLPQKQNIETQTDSETTNLNNYKQQLETLINTHRATVADLNQQLSVIATKLQLLNNEVTTDTVRLKEIASEKAQGLNKQRDLRSRLATENNTFTYKQDSLNQQISYSSSTLANLAGQDQSLMDNVETVQGSVSLQWISLYDISTLYLSKNWVSYAFIIAAVAAYFYGKSKKNEISV